MAGTGAVFIGLKTVQMANTFIEDVDEEIVCILHKFTDNIKC